MARALSGYSRLVAILKLALPLAAIGLVASVFLVSAPDDFEGSGLAFSNADLTALRSTLRVKDAVFTGRGDNGETYAFSADLVIPDSPKPSRLAATAFRVTILYPDGKRWDFNSPTAEVWMASKLAEFSGGVSLQTSDGFTATGTEVQVNFRDGTIKSEQPITATGTFGTINAGAFRVLRPLETAGKNPENTVILFENGVKLVLLPADGR